MSEVFEVSSRSKDALDRLMCSTRNGSENLTVDLDAIGNILWKQDVCPTGDDCNTYHATRKRAVVSAGGSHSFDYDANGNMKVRNGSSIGYTSYNLPNAITAGSSSSAISYGAFRNRYKQVAQSAAGTETTLCVAGLFEIVTGGSLIEYRHYIVGGNGAAAIHTRRAGSSSTSDTVYVHRDQLGSPELITDAAGDVVVRLSFGAYGERRDGSDWDGPPSSADLAVIGNIGRRGFTEHEHLDAVGLIHMNGRVYEPVAGRFLSVDPLIDGFDSSQGPNSFAYVHNNPLTFSDPFGLSHDCEDVTGCSHGDGWWDECDWGGPWMAGWSPSCEDQYYLGPQGDEVVDITGPGSGQNPTPLTPAEAWDGYLHPSEGLVFYFSANSDSMGWKTGQSQYELMAVEACALQNSCGETLSFLEEAFYVVGPIRGIRIPRFSRLATPGGLAAHEGLLGGHTLAKHVNIGSLSQRLIDEPLILAASRFASREIAEASIGAALDVNQSVIRTWLQSSGGRLAISHRFATPIGETLARGAASSTPASSVTVILRRYTGFPGGFRIHTVFLDP